MVAHVEGRGQVHIHTLEGHTLLRRASVLSDNVLSTGHLPETLSGLWVSFQVFLTTRPSRGHHMMPIRQRDETPRLKEAVLCSSHKSQGWSRDSNQVCLVWCLPPQHQLCYGLNCCPNSSPAPGYRPCAMKLCSSSHKTVCFPAP